MSVPHEKVEELVRGAKLLRGRLTTQQPDNIAILRKQLDLNEGQVLAALDIVAENDIPLDLLVLKLVEIAEHFKALQKAQSTLSSDDPKAASVFSKPCLMLRTSRNDYDVALTADPLFGAEAKLHLALEHPHDLFMWVTVRLDMDAGPDAPPDHHPLVA
jgi:hypothetical protein